MHFRQERWRSLQLAPAQVTSSESVYWDTPAYSYQCQPLSKCVGCWSHCQPASIHSNVCPWERPAIFSWPKGLNQCHTEVHACMHAHTCTQVCTQNKTVKQNVSSLSWFRSAQCIHECKLTVEGKWRAQSLLKKPFLFRNCVQLHSWQKVSLQLQCLLYYSSIK